MRTHPCSTWTPRNRPVHTHPNWDKSSEDRAPCKLQWMKCPMKFSTCQTHCVRLETVHGPPVQDNKTLCRQTSGCNKPRSFAKPLRCPFSLGKLDPMCGTFTKGGSYKPADGSSYSTGTATATQR